MSYCINSAVSISSDPFDPRSESVYVCGAAVRRKSVYARVRPVRESVFSLCSVCWKGVGD